MDKKKHELIADTVAKYFEGAQQKDTEILKQLQLNIFGLDSKDSDLYMIYKLLPEEYADKLIEYFDGGTVTFPTKEEMRVLKLTAIVYFLRKIKNYPWRKVRSTLNIEEDSELTTALFSRRIERIDEHLRATFKILLSKLSEDAIEKMLLEGVDQ